MYFNTSSDNSCSFKLNLTNIIATLSTPEKSGYTADRTVVPKPEQPATPVDNGTDIIATPSTPETTEEEHLTV